MPEISKFSDEELAVYVRQHDQEEYRELVKRYQSKLLSYAKYLVKDNDLALDIVQEAFIKAFINLNSFDENKKFSSWIYRILHNEAINSINSRKKIISVNVDEMLAEVVDIKVDVEKEAEKEEIKKIMHKCLDELSTEYKEPLILYYFEERQYEEISDILRLPLGTVCTRIQRGKKALRLIYLEKEGKNDRS
jgi:RNA polymerase sigma-70 factor (ECF subfamily)